MGKKLIGITGIVYQLEDEYIAKGGEGEIYGIKDNDKIVAKLYKEKCRTPERKRKLEVMVSHHLNDTQLSQITWPRDMLFDDSEFMGYVMPKLKNAKNLNSVYAENLKEIGLKERVTIAYNICVAVGEIHKIGQVCGDLNPQNICVNLDKTSINPYHVTLVDTDSYHITRDGNTYRCNVGLAQYIAPELQNRLSDGWTLETLPLPTFSKETDLFALAVHIFNLLMGGCHPFACAKDTKGVYENTMQAMAGQNLESVVLPQPDENIKEGFFPFYHKREGVTYPLYAPTFESLPEEIRNMFIRTFDLGYNNPFARVTAEEWKAVLRKYASTDNINQCDNGHMYFSQYNKCPYCEATDRTKQIMMCQFSNMSPEADEYIKVEAEEWANDEYRFKNMGCISVFAIIAFIIFLLIVVKIKSCVVEPSDINNDIGHTNTVETQSTIAENTLSVEEQERENLGFEIYQLLIVEEYNQAIKMIEDYAQNGDEGKIYIQNGVLVKDIFEGYGLIVDTENCWIYLGDVEYNQAHGNGIEVGESKWGYYTLSGTFENGYANGECILYTSEKRFSDGTSYSSTITGTYTDGWEDGSMNEKVDYLSGNEEEVYYWDSVKGERQLIKYSDGEYIYGETVDGEWYLYYTDETELYNNGAPRAYY